MVCDEVRAQLLAPDDELNGDAARHVTGCAGCTAVAAALARLERHLHSSLVVSVPSVLEERLSALVPAAGAERALRSAVIVEPPLALQERLAALVPSAEPATVNAWRILRARPGVLAGQLAALAVLAYAVLQLVAWMGTLPLVVGDIPYALELLVLSPAVDYLAPIEALVQQLGLWSLVGVAAWLMFQAVPLPRQREP